VPATGRWGDRHRAGLAGFVIGGAGMLAVMYSTQAILPALSRDFDVRAAEAGLTISVVVLAVAIGGMAKLWGGFTMGVILNFLSLRGAFGTYDDVMFGAGWVAAEDRSLIMNILRGPGRQLSVPGRKRSVRCVQLAFHGPRPPGIGCSGKTAG